MDRATLEQHLAQACEHVAHGEDHVAQQRGLVARLERDGHDATEARRLLGSFEEMLLLHIADRDRLQHELAAFPSRP